MAIASQLPAIDSVFLSDSRIHKAGVDARRASPWPGWAASPGADSGMLSGLLITSEAAAHPARSLWSGHCGRDRWQVGLQTQSGPD